MKNRLIKCLPLYPWRNFNAFKKKVYQNRIIFMDFRKINFFDRKINFFDRKIAIKKSQFC